MRWCVLRILVLAMLVVCLPRPASAQTVQATRGAYLQRIDAERANALRLMAAQARVLAKPVGGGELKAEAADDARTRTTLYLQSLRTLDAQNDDELVREYATYRALAVAQLPAADQSALSPGLNQLRTELMGAGVGMAPKERADFTTMSVALPQLQKRRDVDFVLGLEGTGEKHRSPAWSMTVGTNLPGAAVGAVVGGLSDGLKNYFTNLTSFDVELPLDDRSSVASTVGLGLGELSIGKFYVWPVLGMDQLGSNDARLPNAVAQSDTSSKNWASPVISIGMALKDPQGDSPFKQAAIAASIGFPQYIAGSGLDALKALVTNDRQEFKRAGKVRVTIAIAVPIARMK